jgi:hypothetical protein
MDEGRRRNARNSEAAAHSSAMPAAFPQETRRELDELAQMRPELWAKCYPKIFTGVDGGEYYSAKLVGYFLFAAALKLEFPEPHLYKPNSETFEAIWASQLAAYRVPIFWLSREITEALKLTTLPVTLNLTTMKLPFEAAVFMLPKGSLVYQSEATDVVCVSYARAGMREEIPCINPSATKTVTGRGDFTVFAAMLNSLLLNWSHPWEQPLDITQLDATIQDTPKAPLKEMFDDDLTTEAQRFLARAAHLVFNTLQLMLTKPALVSMGSPLKQVQNKRKSVKTFWIPNIIGKDYRLRRGAQSLGGTHASPRGHWVRGFWRDQACGPKFSEHKETWIEPFWRGGE